MPDILRLIADNPLLLESLKKTLEAQFTLDALDKNQSNELLGQAVKARLEGLALLHDGLRLIEQNRTVKGGKDAVMPGR